MCTAEHATHSNCLWWRRHTSLSSCALSETYSNAHTHTWNVSAQLMFRIPVCVQKNYTCTNTDGVHIAPRIDHSCILYHWRPRQIRLCYTTLSCSFHFISQFLNLKKGQHILEPHNFTTFSRAHLLTLSLWYEHVTALAHYYYHLAVEFR